MSPSLSAIVFSVALLPAIASVHLHRTGAHPAMVWALSWASGMGFVVAIAALNALCRHTTGMLGKKPDGLVRWWSWSLFAPYHLGLRIKFFLGKLISSEPLYTKILPGWYLGGWPSSAKLLPPGRPSVVDLTCELPRTHNHKYAMWPVWDTQAPTLQQLDQAVEWSLSESAAGRPVYIHCAHGHGRSATVMGACFIESGLAKTVDHAVSTMKGARPKVHLSKQQRQVLEQWAERRVAAWATTSPLQSIQSACKKSPAAAPGGAEREAVDLVVTASSTTLHRQALKPELAL